MTVAPRITIGIVGFGKIAQTEHVPAIRANDHFSLHCIADQATDTASIPHYRDVESMLAAADAPAAVAICTPPQVRHRVARHALACGKHVLLEKPPCATLDEARDLIGLAQQTGTTLFCAWHSRFAPAIQPARDWLATRTVHGIRIVWHEDVRLWHPQQRWIWQPGGCGVFDAGINALSVVTAIVPRPFVLREARLQMPANCDTPIAAQLTLSNAAGFDLAASFNWLHEGQQTWEIAIDTNEGTLLLSGGGSELHINAARLPLQANREYPHLYERFAELIASGDCDADLAPFELVTQALEQGRKERVAPFIE